MRGYPAPVIIFAIALMAGCAENQANFDCDKILKNAEREECTYNKSMIMLSSVECTNIMNETMKKDCIDQIGIRLLDYIPCKQHDKSSAKDNCEGKVSAARKRAKEANPGVRLP
ncbi:MAG: hypothetical protein V1875_09405 [Candidatus Altiarchaeota archaeon]